MSSSRPRRSAKRPWSWSTADPPRSSTTSRSWRTKAPSSRLSRCTTRCRPPSRAFVDNVEVVAHESAKLTVVTLHDWADDTVQLSHHHVVAGRDAQVKHVVVTFGGDLVRTATTSTYDGPGGEIELLGLYYADAGQHIENRLLDRKSVV